jgi:hypothetical protein
LARNFQNKIRQNEFYIQYIFPIFHIRDLTKICGHDQFVLKSDTLHKNVDVYPLFGTFRKWLANNFGYRSEKCFREIRKETWNILISSKIFPQVCLCNKLVKKGNEHIKIVLLRVNLITYANLSWCLLKTIITLKVTVFRDVTLHSLVDLCEHFGGIRCRLLQVEGGSYRFLLNVGNVL